MKNRFYLGMGLAIGNLVILPGMAIGCLIMPGMAVGNSMKMPGAANGDLRGSNGIVLEPARGHTDVPADTRLRLTIETERLAVAVGEAGNLELRAGNRGVVRVFDAVTGEAVDSLDLSIPAGPVESRTYGSDCDYTKIPYDYARTTVPTNRDTRPGTPSGTAIADTTDYQLTIIGGFTDGFHFHPVIARGNTATVYLHNNVLLPGRTYRVEMDPGIITADGFSFAGIKDWTFTTKQEWKELPDTIRVGAKEDADFRTVQGALDAIPDFSEHPYVIAIAPGDYEEIVYARNKSNLTIMGAGKESVRVHYANNEVFNPHPLNVKTNEWPGTFPSRRAAFALDNCNDIVIKDITIATDLTGQAEGLLLMGERIALDNVHIIGSGDALQANGTVYMQNCELDGSTDSILGRGSLFAYRCDFRNDGGPFTWVRNTKGNHGDVFVECTFSTEDGKLADYGRTPYNKGKGYPDAELVFIDCKVKNLRPEGWSNLGLPTVTMLEHNTRDMETGEPIDVSRRHEYSRQLTLPADKETIDYYRNPANILKGWKPQIPKFMK